MCGHYPSDPSGMKFSVSQISHKGGRLKNEDRIGYGYTRESSLFVLADGMGGHPQGEVAARIALRTIAALYQHQAQPVLHDVKGFLASAVMAGHQQIIRYADGKGMHDAPHTTVVVAVVQDDHVTWAHCGDSRLYVVRNGKVLARTRDHSYAEYRRAPQGAQSINRNLLLSCLGAPVLPTVDIPAPRPLRRGDRIMLCSDGLWSMIDEARIARILSARPVSAATHELVEMALDRGGASSDNVSMIAVEWEPPSRHPGTHEVCTDSIDEGVFASTIQAGLPASCETDELEGDAIDHWIAEINATVAHSVLHSKT